MQELLISPVALAFLICGSILAGTCLFYILRPSTKKKYGITIGVVIEKYLVDTKGGLVYLENGKRFFASSGIISMFMVGDQVIISYSKIKEDDTSNTFRSVSKSDPDQMIRHILSVENLSRGVMNKKKKPIIPKGE
jgi:hypothetical protein